MKSGDIIKFLNWHGKALETYRGTTGDIVRVLFVKNVFKGQEPELIPADCLEPATLEDLQNEVELWYEQIDERLAQILGTLTYVG